jgi:hypothetical protein
MRETILSVLGGHDDQHRVVVALRQFMVGSSQMILRHESWSEDVGWFAQSTVHLSPEQVGGLRSALGVQAAGIGSPVAACHGCVADTRPNREGREVISLAAHRAG